MTVRQRLLLLRLLEKQEQHPEYLQALGISIHFYDRTKKEEHHV